MASDDGSDGTGFTPVKSADRALRILEVLGGSRRDWSLANLAGELDIPKSSMHGLLRTMQQRGWVEGDASGAGYRLGVRALLVGASYVESDAQVLRTRPTLDWLSDETGETVHLGRLDDGDIVYLAKRESRHPLRLFSAIGRRLPAHTTALGKAVLAELPGELREEALPEALAELTPNTITDRGELDDELEATRERGYAIDREENTQGICCFAVSIRTDDPPSDAISISVPLARLDDERTESIVELLQAAQRRIEQGSRREFVPG